MIEEFETDRNVTAYGVMWLTKIAIDWRNVDAVKAWQDIVHGDQWTQVFLIGGSEHFINAAPHYVMSQWKKAKAVP